MRGLIQRYGVPIALYTDRHSVFKNVPELWARRCTHTVQSTNGDGRDHRRDVIQMAFAMSPQAKGRVERHRGNVPG